MGVSRSRVTDVLRVGNIVLRVLPASSLPSWRVAKAVVVAVVCSAVGKGMVKSRSRPNPVVVVSPRRGGSVVMETLLVVLSPE